MSLCVLLRFLNVESHDYMAYIKISDSEWEAAVPGRAMPRRPAEASVVAYGTLAGPFRSPLRSVFLNLLVRKWATKSIQWAQLAFKNRERNRM